MYGGVSVLVAGMEDAGGEIGDIRGVGEELGFEAEAVVFLVGLAGFAGDGAIEEVSGVELDARQGGVNFHDAAGGGFVDGGGMGESFAESVDDEVVVETPSGKQEFYVVKIDYK